MLLLVSNSNPSAAGDTVTADPGAHSCVVQNKNSRTAVVQFRVSLSSFENLLNLNPNEAVFIGDSISDYNAAISSAVHFIARLIDSTNDQFENLNIESKILDLKNLYKIIDSLNKLK